ncbi:MULTISPECIES: NADPH:quinone reductase [Burkholderiaceae]|jgi:NADPH2:quinone reductase|uniref:Quinone oxidoreductase n=1 Tax=Caballeronia sordidicola TaxID=196367 RepID=A0A242MTE0_CABSO|nr:MULTISPECIES: NADPH:quinone reductase [Burkholderiaceae]AME25536.1 NADPH:quinone oxidoreductase [Burkholderia sp. PAMC 26561]OTP74654.1 Quinone oxidoreductase [Caballeronia sordidicola]
MKAAWYERNGAAREVLTVGELDNPAPQEGEVCVQVKASGVNPSDVKGRSSRPPMAARITPHSDGAGVITSVGRGVPESRIGERVWLWNGQWKRAGGTAAEYIALPAEQAVDLPDNTSFDEGACLGIPALTALRALTIDGTVLGKTVLVTGGAGAVGAYAIQFARLLGAARVVTTVSSDAKAQIAKGLGADDVINYRNEDVVARVKALTNGRGVDRIVEVDAAANAALYPAALARDGMGAIYGSGKPQVQFDFLPMIQSGAAIRFFIVYELSPAARAETVSALNGYLKTGALNHNVAERFSLEHIVEAHEAVESGRLTGNAVVTL